MSENKKNAGDQKAFEEKNIQLLASYMQFESFRKYVALVGNSDVLKFMDIRELPHVQEFIRLLGDEHVLAYVKEINELHGICVSTLR